MVDALFRRLLLLLLPPPPGAGQSEELRHSLLSSSSPPAPCAYERGRRGVGAVQFERLRPGRPWGPCSLIEPCQYHVARPSLDLWASYMHVSILRAVAFFICYLSSVGTRAQGD
ncbi:hypothetical protein PAHAL_6G060700 [Panicum hallii]|uniref:Secreted protein n=1 Tax=Panicum hallii TaxID=206008 RepID=A0A2T8IFC4_9POAL|nr:hypothetical protein PAHAL_6G060700 [Panicum hallii]